MKYRSIRHDEAYAETVQRVRSIGPGSERLWGVMDHTQLLPHLVDGMRLAMRGDGSEAKGFMATSFMRRLVIHKMKWPPGKAKAPAGAFQRQLKSWDEDRAELLTLIDQYRSTPPEEITSGHPIFGDMRPVDWDVLTWRHLDHHLRQFSA